MLCLFLCLLAGAELPAPGTPNTSYMQVVSPRIRAAQKMCCGMCCGKFGFLPQTCLKQSHTSAFRTTPNDSLSVPRSFLTFPFRPKPTGAQWILRIQLPRNSCKFRQCIGSLLWDLLWDLQIRVVGYEGVTNSVRCPSPTRNLRD